MVMCLMCGAANSFGDAVCRKCAAVLPRLIRVRGEARPEPQRAKYLELRRQTELLIAGERTWERFAQWFEGFSTDIAERIQIVVESVNQSHGRGWSYYEEFPEEVETVFAGVEDYDQALARIDHAIESKDTAALAPL
jgi:hypothetical protein